MYEKLFVFDFDGTIFASPPPPDDWQGGWWGKAVSLEYPNVPEKPDSKWYNSSVVNAAKKAISDPKVLAVMMTGRKAIPELMRRIERLCKNQGLIFDEMHFSPKKARSYKYDRIRQILAENPSIMELQVWDDANHSRFRNMFMTLPNIKSKLHALQRFEPPTLAKSASGNYKSKKKVKTESGEMTVYEYSDRQKTLRHNRKAERLEELKSDLSDLRAKYRRDLESKNPRTRLTALAVALIDLTYERVGNDTSAENGHYGVTGWEVRHLNLSDTEATIKYVGKSGVKQEKVVSNPRVLKVLREHVKGKKKSDCVFYDAEEDFKISPQDVNEYLSPFNISAKDLRGLHANKEMSDRLKNIRKENGDLPTNRKERKAQLKSEFDRALEEAAAAVGHEPETLRTNYLVPSMEDHFMKHGEPVSDWSKKADLSPPLGFPGGACHVVDRIEDEVRSESLQNALQDKVESGKDLTNPEASKVYRIEKERGVGPIQSIRITSHAQYRMDLRGITVQEIRLFLSRFVRYAEAQKARKNLSPQFIEITMDLARGEAIRWTEAKMGLTVVFDIRNREATIVTAWWGAVETDHKKPVSCDRRAANPDSEFSTYTRIIDRGSTEQPLDNVEPYHNGPFEIGPTYYNKPSGNIEKYNATPGATPVSGDTPRTIQWQPYPTKNRTAIDLIRTYGPRDIDPESPGLPSRHNPNFQYSEPPSSPGSFFIEQIRDKDGPVPSNGSGKVIPYVTDTQFANRMAAKSSEILAGLDPKILARAKSIDPKLARVDKKNSTWTFKVPGSKDTYTVKIKLLPGAATNLKSANLSISCTCSDWIYGGAEYHAKTEGYLLGKPQGTATQPTTRDPNNTHRVCKHVAAALTKAEGYFMPRNKQAAASYWNVTASQHGSLMPFSEAFDLFQDAFPRARYATKPSNYILRAFYGDLSADFELISGGRLQFAVYIGEKSLTSSVFDPLKEDFSDFLAYAKRMLQRIAKDKIEDYRQAL